MKNTKQASKLLKIKESQTRKHAKNQGVKKVGRDYIFTDADIEKIKERLGKVAKPPKVAKCAFTNRKEEQESTALLH
jgi:hypothetical protein